MRTTVNLDDDLLKRAQELTGIEERSALLRAALTALIQREAAHRLARLGGTGTGCRRATAPTLWMILVDTSIWVTHARQPIEPLSDLLARQQVLGHPFVLGELALGGFKADTLRLLSELPPAVVATNEEVLKLIIERKFAGRGVGYVDPHILASGRLTERARVWTRDKRMRAVADDLGVLADLAR